MLVVRAAGYDAAAAMPLVERAKKLGVETLFMFDEIDAQLIVEAPSYQDCPFAELNMDAVAAIKQWKSGDKAAKNQR